MLRRILPAAIGLMVIFAALFAWRQFRQPPAPSASHPPTPVSAVIVEPRSVPDELTAIGALQAVQVVTLAPETAGRIVAIRFEAGQQVRAGTPLIQLFDARERADLAAAKAKADFARTQLARSKELEPRGVETRERLQLRQSDLDQANAAILQLQARITEKLVIAPFDGEIGLRRVNVGQYLNAGDAIATLTNLDRLYVNFTVPQQEISRITVGAVVRVETDAWPDREFTARINAVEPVVSTDTRNIDVQATLSNPDRALRPGMYVTARIVLPPQSDVLVVPGTAIQTSASGDSVVLVRGENPTREGTAEIVPVRTGRRIGDDVIITDGVRPGDVLVISGQLRLQPGAVVEVSPPTSTATP